MAMIYQSTYEDGRTQPITLSQPNAVPPFVAQSCYAAFGSTARVDLCRSINDASEAIFNALMKRGQDRDQAHTTTGLLVDQLLRHMGYELTSTEQI
jgi:hypothetical protein